MSPTEHEFDRNREREDDERYAKLAAFPDQVVEQHSRYQLG